MDVDPDQTGESVDKDRVGERSSPGLVRHSLLGH